MSEQSFGSWKMYDKNGVQVTISKTLDNDQDWDSAAHYIQAGIDAMIRSGFTANAPGVVEGEEAKEVGFVCRRAKINDDGSETPVIDLYPNTDNPEVKYKMFTLYLNNADMVAQFEQATGLTLAKLPVYDGETALQRDSAKASRFIVATPLKPKAALTPNPNYNPDEKDVSKRKPKYRWAHWVGLENPTKATASNESTDSGGKSDDSAKAWWENEFARKKIAEAFAAAGKRGKDVVVAMGQMEHGVTKLSQSKAKNVAEYLQMVEDTFGTKAGVDDEDQIPF